VSLFSICSRTAQHPAPWRDRQSALGAVNADCPGEESAEQRANHAASTSSPIAAERSGQCHVTLLGLALLLRACRLLLPTDLRALHHPNHGRESLTALIYPK